jgi:hypothetical protein
LIANLDNDEEATEYLRLRTYLLSYRGKKTISLPTKMRAALPRKPQEPIASEVPPRFVVNDIATLPAESLLVENAEFAVYAARASELPHLLDELGRLREITFRAAGEGTCCSGTKRNRNWRVLTAPATPMRSSAATASRASTRTPCSATTNNCS